MSEDSSGPVIYEGTMLYYRYPPETWVYGFLGLGWKPMSCRFSHGQEDQRWKLFRMRCLKQLLEEFEMINIESIEEDILTERVSVFSAIHSQPVV